jgi:AraC-like DNA-binding protein
MRNWKISPKDSSVAKYIDCYWLLNKTVDDDGPVFPKLNPDPAGHLIFTDSLQPYHYQSENYAVQGLGSHFILPHSKTFLMDHSQPFLVVGIKFHVGALYSLKLPNSKLELDKVLGINSKKLLSIYPSRGMNPSSWSPEALRDYFDKQLSLLISAVHIDIHSELVSKIMGTFPIAPLSDIGGILSCSQRTIERSFLRVTGFTLKQYDSMQRLERLLDYVHKLDDSKLVWADIALQFGFSDQPHLARYFKNVIGNTPGKYAQLRDLAIDAYGNFE